MPKPVDVPGAVVEKIRANQPYKWQARNEGAKYLRGQREFAAELGVSERTLRRYETGGVHAREGSPLLAKLRELASRCDPVVKLTPTRAELAKMRPGTLGRRSWGVRRIRRYA